MTIRYLLENNSPEILLIACLTGLLVLAALMLVRNLLVKRIAIIAKRTTSVWDDVLVEALASTKLPFLGSLALLAAAGQLELPPGIAALPYKAMLVLLIIQVGIWSARGIRAWTTHKRDQRLAAGDGSAATNLAVISFIGRLLLWVMILLLLLDNLGFDITALVASLGIGGVAVALALQNILGDLFASLSIAFDKPFVVGDFIIVGDFMGTVKYVGLKTTRIQSLSGEELVFSNNDLLSSRIRNYKRMAERRAVFTFGVTYATDPAALEALPAVVRGIVEQQENTRFDRAHFKGFGASSLDFEVVYFVLLPDFNLYMDIQQAINLALMRHCAAQGIEFAFPTQTIHVASMPQPAPAEDRAGIAEAPPARPAQ